MGDALTDSLLTAFNTFPYATSVASTAPVSGSFVTLVADGMAKATATIVASSVTKNYDGFALETPSGPARRILIQRGGVVPASYVTGIGTSTAADEQVVADSTGAPKRASAASGPVVGKADAAGNLWLLLPVKGDSSWSRTFLTMGA